MSKYFILIHSSPQPGPTVKKIKGTHIDLTCGQIMDISEPFEYLLQVDSKIANPINFQPLDFQRIFRQCLFSTKFQKTLKDIGVDNIQYFPAKVIYEPTGKEVEYKIANVIGVVKALDTEASILKSDKCGFAYYIKKLVLKENKLHNLDFFRLYEMMDLIVVSQRIADILNTSNLTGIRIIETSEWHSGIV